MSLIYPNHIQIMKPRRLRQRQRVRVLEPQGSVWALDFDGVNEYVEVAYSTDFESLSKVTVLIKFKLNQLPSDKGENGILLVKRHSVSPWNSFQCYVIATNNKVVFELRNSSGAAGSAFSTYAIAAGTKYWVAGVYDGANVTIYVDTVAGTSIAQTGSVFDSNASLRIGASSSTVRRFNGQIDTVLFYGRVLSVDEIRRQRENPQLQPDMRGLIFWHRYQHLDSLVSGKDNRDWSGNGHEGVMTNFADKAGAFVNIGVR